MPDLVVRRGASRATDPRTAVAELYAAIAQPDCALVIFYCSPQYERDALAAELRARFVGVRVVGCTTAAEIGPLGYLEGSVSGVSIAGDDLRVVATRIDGLGTFRPETAASCARQLVAELLEDTGDLPGGDNTFGFLLIDGLCGNEELVVAALHRNLGDIHLVGGSAGDGQAFGETHVFHDGVFHRDAAVFLLVKSRARFEVFKTAHFIRGTEKLVVTEADPERRLVTEVNGAPAAEEYARMVGVDVAQLTPAVFGAHPVMVRMGDEDYVRSIRTVNPDGSLTFFCAIDEGIVFTAARHLDLVQDLDTLFTGLRERLGVPDLVLGCDCILRHVECDARQLLGRVGQMFADNHVVGFATYGEQYNAMHINQTFTGVALASRDRVHGG